MKTSSLPFVRTISKGSATLSIASLTAAVLLALAVTAPAANFTTTVQEASATPPNDWNQNGGAPFWQPGNVAPTAGNTYECIAGGGPTRIRNPATAGVQTFPGDSLQLDSGSEIRAKGVGATLDFPGVGGNPGLILNGGNMDTGDDSVFPVTGLILVQANSSFSCGDTAGTAVRGWQIAAQLQGSGNLSVSKNAGGGVNAMEVTSVNNPYSGNWTILSSGFKGTGSNSLGSGSITISPTSPATNNVVFEVLYDLKSSGGLILTNGGQMNLHQNCTFTNVMIETTTLSPGLHPYAELVASFPANFVAGGSGSLQIGPPAPPCIPTNIVVINGDSQVILSWDPACNAASYFVKRSLVSGSGYTVVGTPTGTSFTDTTVANSGTYYYVISATNSIAESGNSVEVVGKPNTPVTGLTAARGTGQISLAWNPLPGATGYRVQRGVTTGGPYTNIVTGVAGTSYIDTNLLSGKTYYYTVVASLAAGESGISNEASATTAPSAPTNMTAVLFAGTVIRLGWTNSDPVRPIYLVQRSTNGVDFSTLTPVAAAQSSYTNSGLLLGGSNYYYRLQAQGAGGFSPYSIVVSNQTPPVGSLNVNFSNGTNSSQQPTPAPAPPGYLVDTSELFGDRGNGFFYGWSTFGGTNLTRDTRWRKNPISPDLRYDTFAQLQKDTVPGHATWEIQIPNGFYWVHMVAGDSDNAPDTHQFVVEGTPTLTLTTAAAPPLAHWVHFTNTALVNDGRLTITTGPSAGNDKLDFIDIYPAVSVGIMISQDPVSASVVENRPLSLSVSVTPSNFPPNCPYCGFQPITYQWYTVSGGTVFNALANATNSTLTLGTVDARVPGAGPIVHPSDAGNYVAVATNPEGSVTSHVAVVTVTVDSSPPVIVSVGSVDGTYIGVCFNELIDPSTVSDSFDYSITDSHGLNTTPQNGGITVRADGKSLQIQLDPSAGPIHDSFTLTTGIADGGAADLKGNQGPSSGSGRVSGFTAMDVGYTNPPPVAGLTYTCKDGDFDVTSGGTNIWGNVDQGQLTLKSWTNDFDARVEITGITMADPISKAGLMVRQSFASNDVTLYMSMNPPPPGRDTGEAGIRSLLGTNTIAWTPSTNYVHVDGVSNAWQRLTRAGNVFKAYHSSNGVDWVLFAQTNQVFTDPVLVGFGTTAHTGNTNLTTTALYRNFSVSSGMVANSPTITPGSAVLSGGAFRASFSTQAGVNYAVDYINSLSPPRTWSTFISPINGDGTTKSFTNNAPLPPGGRFYRIHVVP